MWLKESAELKQGGCCPKHVMQLATQRGVCRVSEWWGCSVKKINIEINNCCCVAADAGDLKREKGGCKGEMPDPLTSGFWFFHCFVVCFCNPSEAR